MKPRRTDPGGWLLIAALLLRVGWVGYAWLQHGPALVYDDEKLHWQLATNLVHHGTLISDDGRYAARMPVYPLFLALLAGFGPAGILLARLSQAVLGALTTLVAYRLAERAAGRRAALVAGLLACCDPFAIFFANLLLSEVLFTLLLVALVACAWRWTVQRATDRTVVIGLALLGPALLLTRPSAAALIPLVWLLMLWLAPDRRRALAQCVLCVLVLLVAVAPWGLRNQAVLGTFAWLSTNGGVTLYDAQGPQADGSSNQAFLRDRPELQDLDEVALDRTLTHLAREQMQRDPWRVLRLAEGKFLRTWSLTPNVAEYRSGLAAYAGAGFTALTLVGAAAGLIRSRSRQIRSPAHGNGGAPGALRAFHALLWMPLVYFTLVHCIYIGSVRYRVPLMPLLALAAGTALVRPITQPPADRSAM